MKLDLRKLERLRAFLPQRSFVAARRMRQFSRWALGALGMFFFFAYYNAPVEAIAWKRRGPQDITALLRPLGSGPSRLRRVIFEPFSAL